MEADQGWQDIEQTFAAAELPPIPPTSDPQRLLSYVLNILPRYTEMEMLSTHLRLYSSTLEQEMEQAKSHVRILTREVESEREKKLFLERYAAQIVKERNDILHAKSSARHGKKTTTGASAHFAWHSCCKKSTNHALDMTPSIAAFRGEKLQECMREITSLQDEVRNQELLRNELEFLLKKTQREHDCKVTADHKHIQQLEKQLLQRSMLHSGLERKLYDVESALARHDKVKDDQVGALANQYDRTKQELDQLELENQALKQQVNQADSDYQTLRKSLEATTSAKEEFARQVDDLNEKYRGSQSEMESLRSEIEVLQSADMKSLMDGYNSRIEKLQQQHAAQVQQLIQEVDALKLELKRRESIPISAASLRDLSHAHSTHSSVHSNEALSFSEQSGTESSGANCSRTLSDHFEDEAVGSSLSRSQLSESVHSSHSWSHLHESFEYLDPTETENAEGVKENLSDALGQSLTDNNDNVDGPVQYFNWETFLDSSSDDVSPRASSQFERSGSAFNLHAEQESEESDHDHEHLDTIPEPLEDKRPVPDNNAAITRQLNESSAHSQWLDLDFEDEEKEDNDIEGRVSEDKEIEAAASEPSEQNQENPVGDLMQELQTMLQGIEKRRVEEEKRAALTRQAFLEFETARNDLQNPSG